MDLETEGIRAAATSPGVVVFDDSVLYRGIKRPAAGDAAEVESGDSPPAAGRSCAEEEEGGPRDLEPAEAQAAGEGRSECTAATSLQKSYRSYRTRRRLADSAVVAEELWWQAIDYARLNHSTVSFFNYPETAISRWNRIGLVASKVGKGLYQDEKAQKLAFQHWIEAIDTRHRYGHNLHFYYDEWCNSEAGQPFFFWLDLGDGKNLDLEKCPRSLLRQQCIKYLGPTEREHYEYVVVKGKIVHKQSGVLLHTTGEAEGVKWIFVMSTSKRLYVGQKRKGFFHHSSFLAGGATLAAGRMSAEEGVLTRISSYSGHYRPTDQSRDNFLAILRVNGVDIAKVQIASSSKDYYEDMPKPVLMKNKKAASKPPQLEIPKFSAADIASNGRAHEGRGGKTDVVSPTPTHKRTLSGGLQSPKPEVPQRAILERIKSKKGSGSYQLGHQISGKWCSGAGPRIGCIADYPLELRNQALEFVELSPRLPPTPSGGRSRFPSSSDMMQNVPQLSNLSITSP